MQARTAWHAGKEAITSVLVEHRASLAVAQHVECLAHLPELRARVLWRLWVSKWTPQQRCALHPAPRDCGRDDAAGRACGSWGRTQVLTAGGGTGSHASRRSSVRVADLRRRGALAHAQHLVIVDLHGNGVQRRAATVRRAAQRAATGAAWVIEERLGQDWGPAAWPATSRSARLCSALPSAERPCITCRMRAELRARARSMWVETKVSNNPTLPIARRARGGGAGAAAPKAQPAT